MITRVQSSLRTHAVSIGLVVIAFAFMAILVLQTVAINKLQTELQTQQQVVSQTQTILKTLAFNATQRTGQINDLNKHIDCIAQFFAQPARDTKTIVNIETCTVLTANGKISVSFPATTTKASTSTPAPTPAPVRTTAPASTPAPSQHPVAAAPAPALLSPVFDATKKLLKLP